MNNSNPIQPSYQPPVYDQGMMFQPVQNSMPIYNSQVYQKPAVQAPLYSNISLSVNE